jgi:peptidoglycan DL-endopeptidase CwlO
MESRTITSSAREVVVVVDQGAPEPDPFGSLFRNHEAALPPAPSANPLPSRRDLRNAPAASAASRGAQKSAGRPAKAVKRTAKSPKKPRGRAAKGAPQPFARPIDSAYPSNRVIVVRRAAPVKKKRRALSSILALFAVVGLAGSFAAPAALAFTASPTDAPLLAAERPAASESLTVSHSAVTAESKRESYRATSAADLAQQRSNQWKSANYAAYMKSGAREAGDDYPYFSELSVNQGGGLSPFNYFYRECVDFVAWRINRDAGSTSAPYKWVWSNLTPTGGNASQWRYAWQAHGWKTSTKPVKGAVAWFYGNHVGYVNTVNDDGTIVMEDYNHEGTHLYAKRTIPTSDVALFLYPPPANG